MTTEFAIVVLVKVTLSLSLTLAATWMLRRRTAAMRHLIVTAAFLAIALLPFAAAWAPTVAIQTPAVIGSAEDVWFDNADVFLRGVSRAPRVVAPAEGGDSVDAADGYRRLGFYQLLVIVWMLGAGLSMVPVAIGAWEVRRVRRRALPWRHGSSLLRSACVEAGMRRDVEVLLDDVGPAALGIVRPVVLLPPDARAWHQADLRRAVLHELEHVRRHDCLVRLVARMVCAVYWCHPLVWVAWRQLELEAERACDDAVVRVSDPAKYADQLVALAERTVAARRQPLLTMASRNDLARRIVSVLADNRRRGRARLRSVGAVGVCTALLVAGVAPLRAINAVTPALGEHATRDDLSKQPPPPPVRPTVLLPRSTPSGADDLPRVPAGSRRDTQSAPAILGAGLTGDRPAMAPQSNGGVAAGRPNPDEPAPHFDVATVKVNRSGGRSVPPRVLPASGQVTITNATVASVIQDAYGLQLPSQIINIPDWARSLRVDIVAKAESPAPVAMLQRMLQPLLAEYFKLAVHTETREMDAFALVLANPGRLGPQLRKVDEACGSVVGTTIGFARPSDGPDQRQVCGVFPAATAGQIIAHGISLAGLAIELAPSQRRPVIDRTGISGRFDVELTWTPEAFSAAALAQRPGSAPPPGVDPSGPQLPTALRDQLGLKFESTRAAVEVLVIERVEPPIATD